MAQKILFTNTDASKFVGNTSRYKDCRLIKHADTGIFTMEIYKKKKKSKAFSGNNEQWMEIVPGYEYRPDLVSYEVYSTPDFWWKIMEYNNMKDIMDFSIGKTIRLPNNVF